MPRPKPAIQKKRTSIFLPPRTHLHLIWAAKRRHVSVTGLIESLVEEFLARERESKGGTR
jgi:hypothetical protein